MKTILVARTHDAFSRILAENDYEIINLPLIETKISDDLSDFETKLARLENYDGVFITSAKAAQIFADQLHEKNVNFSGKVYVLGERSFEVLRNKKFDLVYNESANTAREMLENIAPEDLKGKRFLFVRGANSLRIVPEFLAKIGEVDEAIVYETLDLKIEAGQIRNLRERFEKNEIAAVCFFSPSAGMSFIEQFGAEILHQTKITTIGKTTAEFFERQNLKVTLVSSKATAENFAAQLLNFFGNGRDQRK